MKRRHRTLLLIILGAVILGSATIIGAMALKSTVSYFYSPSDIATKPPKLGQNIRVGGLVKIGSIVKKAGGITEFIIEDGAKSIKITYNGILPDLFREGQGIIAEGNFADLNIFNAKTILAKHDENYMPKEVADSLKKTGQWKGNEAK